MEGGRVLVRPQNLPAAVILRIALQRGSSSGQAQPREGVVVREPRVRQAGHAIWLVVNVLPVGAEALGSPGERSKQVAIQLVDDLLIHAGFELPGKEGGPHRLLKDGGGVEERGREGRDKEEKRRLGNRFLPGRQANKRVALDVC